MERISIASWRSLATTILLIQIFIIPSLGSSLCTHPVSPPAEHHENADGAVARQSYAGIGAAVYSVLESPLLSLDHVSCVEFRYINNRPTDLGLFGTVNGTDVNLFRRPAWQYPTGNTFVTTVAKDTSKLKFLAYGGGGGAGDAHVSLQQVTILAGNCTGPECNFITAEMCGWNSTSWERRPPGHVQMKLDVVSGTLTTNLVKATADGGLCVMFNYSMDNINDTLSVSILFLNGSEQLVWATTYKGTPANSWSQVWMHIQSATAFQLVFRAVRCNNLQSRIAIKAVTSSPYPYPANCFHWSPGGIKQVSLYVGCSSIATTTVQTEGTTMSTSSLPTTIAASTTIMSGSSSPISTITVSVRERNDADEDSSAGAIAGSVVASIVLIVVVAIVILFWRKRKHQRGDSEEKNNVKGPSIQAHQESSSNVKDPACTIPVFIKPSHPADGDYSEVRDMPHNNTADPYEFAEPIPQEEADTGDTDEYNRLGVHGTRKKDASNPYELARAFPTENTADVNVSDEYHHLSRQGMGSKETEGSTTSEKQGEYSHLGQHSEKKGSGDVYNVVQKNRKGVNTANQAGDEYNKINLKEQGYRKQRGETPDVYNHLGGVNSPDKAKPGLVREDEYNRINLKEKGPQQRGTTTDVYNRLGGDVTPSRACDNGERDKGPDQGTENYNTLDFDRGDEQTEGSGNAGKKTRQGVQAYDHVQDDFQETYSKPQRDKKERVIDSNYDHVTPS